ncbi:MAG: GtrA family protein [Candidatus Pacebacteria bacterium]|nr:GtrA family protein [Candidatus Paceibacterota bacterium]
MASKKVFYEFGKFLTVGAINSFVDFGTLNILSYIFKINSGEGIIVINAVSFSLAIISSYLFNKFWTFGQEKYFFSKEIAFFLMINIFTGILNTAIVFTGTTFFNHYGIGNILWLNFIKIIASVFSAGFNFLGYKFIVFTKK